MITADLHLGHKNIHKYRPQFLSAEQHHEFVYDRLVQSIKPKDTLFLLGDIAFAPEWLEKISAIKCQKKLLVMGNHDTEYCSITDIANCYDEVHSLFMYRKAWFSHPPIHPDELIGRVNIHGHTHGKNIVDTRYFNVSLENTDYRPIDLMRIKEQLANL